MIKQHMITKGIKDKRVLEAMERVPRHLFVDEALQYRAYDDCPLPIGEKQTISQPYMVALMTEVICLSGNERVLEIGTGSGYQSAILCELAEKVFTVERIRSLGIKARKKLEDLGYLNILVKIFDGTLGWHEFAPYDRIIVTAGAPYVPKNLLSQLSENGIMVIPVGDETSQTLLKIEKMPDATKTTKICECTFVKLIGRKGWTES